MIIFFIIAMTVLLLAHTYLGWRLIIPAALPVPWNVLAWTLLGILFILMPLPLILRQSGVTSVWMDRLAWIGFIWLGLFSLIFTFLILRDVVWGVTLVSRKGILWARDTFNFTSSSVNVLNPERRQFLIQTTNLGVLGLSGLLTGYGVYLARRMPDVYKVDIPLKNLPEEFEDFRVVQISDLHVGPTIKRDYVQRVVDQVNQLKPDVVVFTGDFADGSVSQLAKEAAPLADLTAKYGAYFVTGNHEYYSGVHAWVAEARRLGFTVLLNEHRIIEKGAGKLVIAGVTDYTAGRMISAHRSNPAAAINNAPGDAPKLLLAHQPLSIQAAAKAGFDIMLAGHTHGGQYFPVNYLAALQQPYLTGLHKHENTWIYVNRGTGYWGPPMRLGAGSEISLIRLKREISA